MNRKRKFDMGTTRESDAPAPAPAAVDRFVAGGTTVADEEPCDRVNFVLPRRLRLPQPHQSRCPKSWRRPGVPSPHQKSRPRSLSGPLPKPLRNHNLDRPRRQPLASSGEKPLRLDSQR